MIQNRLTPTTDGARLKDAGAPHAGDWLNDPPITAVGLTFSDGAIRVAVGCRLGSATCQSHTCICGKKVDVRGLHGISCRKTPQDIFATHS